MKHLPWNPFPSEACVEDYVFSWPWQCHCDKRSIQYLKKGAEEERERKKTLWSHWLLIRMTWKIFTCEVTQKSTTQLKSYAKGPKSLLRMSLLSYFRKVYPAVLKLFATGLQCVTSLVYTWYYFHLMFKVNSANISEGLPKPHQDYLLLPEKAIIKEQNEL